MAYTTKKSLLEAIQRGDEVSWEEFYLTYRPLVVYCAKKSAVPSGDIDDILQTVMVKVFRAQKRFSYDTQKGKFRDFLGRIINNAIVDNWKKNRHIDYELEGNLISNYDKTFPEMWAEEWHKYILNQSLIILRNKVDETTYQAFELYAINKQKVAKVAEFLGISIQNVYEAKSRCIAILRREIKDLTME